MGTRADFWVQRLSGQMAISDWIGSIAWDGDLHGVEHPDAEGTPGFRDITSVHLFRQAVQKFAMRDDFTHPKDGWPWPWQNSWMTDYAYVFNEPENRIDIYNYGYFRAYGIGEKVAVFPDMKSVQRITMGPRSGLIVLGRLSNE